MRTLVWFRGKDLRISDHGSLRDAAAAGEAIPLFVLDPYFFAPERAREIPHRMRLLLASLRTLAQSLAKRGSRLLVVPGRSVEVVPRLARGWRVDRVVAHRWVEPFARERDRRVREALAVPLQLYEGETLLPPGTLRTSAGSPYSVFAALERFLALARATSGKLRRARPACRALADSVGTDRQAVSLESLSGPRAEDRDVRLAETHRGRRSLPGPSGPEDSLSGIGHTASPPFNILSRFLALP